MAPQLPWQAELFSLLIETSKDYAIFVVASDGRVLTWNVGAERVFGYTEAEILGQSSFIFFTPEDRAAGVPEREIQTALSEGRASDDRWHLKKDGTRLWVTGVMALLRDEAGQPRAFAKVTRDFTEAKLTADSLRESESRLRVALEAADMGTWLWRISTDEQILDDSLRRLVGLRPGEEVLDLNSFLRAVHKDDRDRVRREFERCRNEGGDFNVEFRVVRPEGGVRWLRDQGKAFANEQGRPAFITGACVDITERKAAEDSLRETDRKKNDFLALLAHELRNPLAPLRNGLQVMRLAAEDPKAVAQVRAMMDRQLGHLIRLIDDLLDISRLSQNKLHLKFSRVLLADVVTSAVETARPAIEKAGHDLRVSIPPEPVFLIADLTRLAQVFSNLLSNSAKYTPKGGTIWLTAERRDNELLVEVRDTGVGIPAEALPHVFDMFSQVDRSIERATGGLGIGLALVKGLVEMHGGKVAVHSDGPEQGSTFRVVFPLPGDLVLPVSVDEEEFKGTGPRLRILVVDDNTDSANSMAMMLRLMNNEVRTANDGVAAVQEAERFRPEVVLMDVGMPRLSGLAATRQIREQPWGREMKIFALTGWGQHDDRERSREAGCNGHLVKPVYLDELMKLLRGK